MMSILIIDDEVKHRSLLARLLQQEGYEVYEVGNGQDALNFTDKFSPDMIICDVKLPDVNGVDLTKKLSDTLPYSEIILLTAYGNISDGVKAIKNGAYDYLVKGDDNERIIPILSRVSEKVSLRKKLNHLERTISKKYSFNKILGESSEIKNTIHLAQKVANTDTAILLTGETGTGKEVFAQSIHYNSSRSQQPFVAINCSAFSKELLESELFGHKAGAFTGASTDKKGLVEEANGGTLFLDEIGEMSIDLQPKILRLLENSSFIRVGDTKERKVDIRIISATNRDLKSEIGKSNFREDLYFRIAVFVIALPPLRNRVNDIPIIAEHYLQLYSTKTNKSIRSISKDALKLLKDNIWRGNIRELKNVIERAVILEDSDILSVNSLPLDIQDFKTDNQLNDFMLSNAEKVHIQKVLTHTKGNKTEAARLLNIGIATLYRKIDEYGLK